MLCCDLKQHHNRLLASSRVSSLGVHFNADDDAMIRFSVVVAFATATGVAGSDNSSRWSAYQIISDAPELQRSVDALVELPLWRFEMTHDTVRGRVHHGVLAREAETILGGLYDEVVTRLEAVPGASLSRRVVDQSVLFGHGLAASKRLSQRMVAASHENEAERRRIQELDGRLKPLEARVFEPAWKTVAQLAPLLDLEVEKSSTVETRIDGVGRHLKRRQKVTRAYAETKNDTLLVAHAETKAVDEYEDDVRSQRRVENRLAEEESLKTRELERRTTALAKLADDLVTASERERLKTETAVQAARESELRAAEAERANEDVATRLIRASGEERRKTMVDAIGAAADTIKNARTSINPERLRRMVLGLASVVAAYFVSRETAILARTLAAAYLTRPALVREFRTSRHGGCGDVVDSSVILAEDTADRLRAMADALRGARALRAPLRHVLLYGPPGTGKTTVARRLALSSGLDWAVMSGGDAGPLGSRAATELHRLFGWAKRSSRRGLLLFVDEAEAALADRGKQLSEAAVSALNAFLYHTSDPSYSLVLVLATNRPSDLDSAVLDRVDDVLELPLPDADQRHKLLSLYFNTCFRPPPPSWFDRIFRRNTLKKHIRIAIADEIELKDLVPKTKGFSGREISKLMASVQGIVFSHHCLDGHLTLSKKLWDSALHWKLTEIKPRGATASL